MGHTRDASEIAFDGANVWVTNSSSNTVTKIQAADGAVLGEFSVGPPNPSGIAFDGAYIWVATGGSIVHYSNTITKLWAADPNDPNHKPQTFTVGYLPQGVAFDGVNIWVANVKSASVTKLWAADPNDPQHQPKTIQAGGFPEWVAFDGANIWVTNAPCDNLGLCYVSKIRISDDTVVGQYPIGAFPQGLAFDGTNIWVVDSAKNTVTKLRASDGKVLLSPIPVDVEPVGVVFDGANIWVASIGTQGRCSLSCGLPTVSS